MEGCFTLTSWLEEGGSERSWVSQFTFSAVFPPAGRSPVFCGLPVILLRAVGGTQGFCRIVASVILHFNTALLMQVIILRICDSMHTRKSRSDI